MTGNAGHQPAAEGGPKVSSRAAQQSYFGHDTAQSCVRPSEWSGGWNLNVETRLRVLVSAGSIRTNCRMISSALMAPKPMASQAVLELPAHCRHHDVTAQVGAWKHAREGCDHTARVTRRPNYLVTRYLRRVTPDP